MKKTTRHFRFLLPVLLVLIPARNPVLAEDEESSLPFWDPERYGVHGKYSPWTLSGGVGFRYSYDWQKSKDALGTQAQQQWFSQLRSGKGATGYIMEPYIAQWKTDFMVGLTLSQGAESRQNTRDGGNGSTGEEKSVHLSAQSLQSNVDLRVFPESGFPFNLYFNRANSGNSGSNTDALGRVSQKFGVIQQYRDREAQMNVRLQAERRMDSSGGKDSSGLLPMVLPGIHETDDARKGDMVTLRVDKRLDDHSLEMVGRLSRQDGRTRLGKGLIWERSLYFSHSVSPMEELSINNMANVSRNRDFKRNYDDEALGIYRETDEFQLVGTEQFTSNAFWRSEESPLMLNGTLRIFRENNNNTTTDSTYSKLSPSVLAALGLTRPDGLPLIPNAQLSSRSNGGIIRSRSINARLGAGYRFDPHHNVNGAFSANQEIREVTSDTAVTEATINSLIQSLGYQYDSGPIALEPYSYSWFSGTTFNNALITGQSSVQQLSERIGHGVERAFGAEDQDGLFKLTLEESSGLTYADEPDVDVTHSAGLGYEISPEGARALIELRLTDSRTVTNPMDETQLLNLQLARHSASEGTEQWSGNLSFNWLRHVDETGLQTESQSASGSLRYSMADLMGFPRLRYDMITTVSGDSWALGALGPSEQEIRWRNLLSYNIGKISLRFGGELKYLQDSVGDKSYQALLTFEVVRNFYRRFDQ
ncbi:MAG: hypothetical protein HQM00_05320 [Magnetococcales bacterium]|nr:hypothetical protein [Magnetococcales bacterium]